MSQLPTTQICQNSLKHSQSRRLPLCVYRIPGDSRVTVTSALPPATCYYGPHSVKFQIPTEHSRIFHSFQRIPPLDLADTNTAVWSGASRGEVASVMECRETTHFFFLLIEFELRVLTTFSNTHQVSEFIIIFFWHCCSLVNTWLLLKKIINLTKIW